MKQLLFSFLLFSYLLGLQSCNNNGAASIGNRDGDTITTTASLLSIVEYEEFTIATIQDPWNKGAVIGRYILVPDNTVRPDNLPQGIVIKTPVSSSLVYSSVHAGAINELGAIDRISAICDAQYYKLPKITAGLESGKVIDVGASMSPSIERIIDHEPQIILTSPFQNAGHGAIEQLGIPIVECADYMESSPLGRAEWIKLLGRLYGKPQVADSIYNVVELRYNSLRDSALQCKDRPTVISEMVTDGVWYLPGGRSYMAQIFYDAAASYPWADDTSTGSLQLDFASVYDRAHDADFWFIKTFNNDMTLANLQEDYPLHARMSAFSNGGVYACNTAKTTFFEDFPFHPELLLRDFINIIHPGVLSDTTINYYRQVK